MLFSEHLPESRRQKCILLDAPLPAFGRVRLGVGVIDHTPLGVGRQKYYLEQIAKDREEYLSGHGEAPGYVLGSAAARLGLAGEVTAEQFEHLFIGCDPTSGELLGAAHRKDGRLGWDLVFRPVKSLSLLWAFGTPELSRIAREAHQAGVEAAIAKLEDYAVVRRGRNGVDKLAAEGLLVVGFDHRQSRPGDPLLHTHGILMNRALGPDGRWTALDARPLLAALMEADAVFRQTYQRYVTERTGLEWGPPDEHGNRELVCLPDKVIRHFSKAGVRIEEACAAREEQGLAVTAKVRDMLAHQLRENKCHEHPTTQRQRWVAEAAEKGWHLWRTFDRHAGQARTVDTLHTDVVGRVFDRLSAPNGLTAQASTFTRGQVLRAISNQPEAGTLPVAELERLTDRYLGERAIAKLIDANTRAQRYATPEVLTLEEHILASAAARADEDRHLVPRQVVQATLDRFADLGSPLGEDQAEALWAACTDGAGLSLIVGRAGTGKTFLMDATRLAFEAANLTLPEAQRMTVRGLAPTGIAAMELSAGAGVDAATVDRFLTDLANGTDRLQAGDVVILDEANMLGTRKFARLFAHANQVGAKLIAVGDDKQLQSIDYGGWFRALRLRLGASELVENRRQRDPLDQQAVELIRQGMGDQAMRLYRDGGRVNVTQTALEARTAATADWWTSFSTGQAAVLLAHRRVEVDGLSDMARELMAADDRLSGPTLDVQGRAFQVGDRIVCGLNRPSLHVANGTRGVVTDVNVEARTLAIRTDAGYEVTLPAEYLNRELGKGRRPVDHGYAITGHKAEGVTVDRVFIVGSGPTQEWMYVASTRPKVRADFYLIEAPEPPQLADEIDLPPPASRDPYDLAIAAMARSAPQRLAIDAAAEAQRTHPSLLSTAQLRAERDGLADLFASAPRDQRHRHRQATQQLNHTTAQLAAVESRAAELNSWLASHGRGLAAWTRRDAIHSARAEHAQLVEPQAWLADKHAELEQLERQLARAERQRAAWVETHTADRDRAEAVTIELGWRSRARATARTIDAPPWLADTLGAAPESTRGRRRWKAAAAQVEAYRDRYHITEPGLGPQPPDLAQLRDWHTCHQTVERINPRARDRHLDAGRGMSM